jgi:hypothetical protein
MMTRSRIPLACLCDPNDPGGGDTILVGDSIDDAATWADKIKKARPITPAWHFVDIPLGAGPYAETPNCDCLVSAIRANVHTLQPSTANA